MSDITLLLLFRNSGHQSHIECKTSWELVSKNSHVSVKTVIKSPPLTDGSWNLYYRYLLDVWTHIHSSPECEPKSYLTLSVVPFWVKIIDAVRWSCVEIIPQKWGQSSSFSQKEMAPPAAPQVSGRVIQASVWIPRSIHWLNDLFMLTAEFILNKTRQTGYEESRYNVTINCMCSKLEELLWKFVIFRVKLIQPIWSPHGVHSLHSCYYNLQSSL